MTRNSGASAAAVNSNRTWSFPLPVAPCAMASAFSRRAISIMRLAMSGPGDAGAQEVLVLIDRARLHHGEDEVAGELLLEIVNIKF